MMSVVGYREAYSVENKKLVFKSCGNFIYDGNNILSDGDLSDIIYQSDKLDLSDLSKLDYNQMVKELNKTDIKMWLDDDDLKENLTHEKFDQYNNKIVRNRPLIDLTRFMFDIEIHVQY